MSSRWFTDSPRFEDCTICGEPVVGELYFTPCGHPYDYDCLQELFRKAMNDESLFPPSCCNIPVPFTDVQRHFDNQFNATFEKKSLEFNTKDRVYCSHPTCSAFLGSATEDPSSIECQGCLQLTCGACKQQAHIGRECSLHLDKVVLDMAKDNGWQRCYSCKHVVELTRGCFHMICICKAQFCYLCATPWKECSCPQFEENRL